VADLAGASIAVLNWRDPGHPEAGGAEEYAWRVAGHLRKAGARVTFVTARAPGQPAAETVDGIAVVRGGGRWTVYPRVLAWLARHRRRIDLVLDCQNGIPFFAPLAVRRHTPVVLVMHHVHDAQFGVHFPAPVAAFGRWLEGPAARRVYRRGVATAVSPSTVRAMRERLRWTGPVYVVPNGLDPVPALGPRAAEPTLVYLGRLVAHKRVDRLVAAVAELARRRPGLRLHVVGRGPAEPAVRAAADRAGPAVTVHGYVEEPVKWRLLGASWLHVTLSDGEGWGIAVAEAASAGLPTLCRDVDGLRDSVRPGRTGWLMRQDGPMDQDDSMGQSDPMGQGDAVNDVVEALDRALAELAAPDAAARIAADCREWAARFDWATTGQRVADLAATLLRGERPGPGWAADHALAEAGRHR
jgi:glycosyltransferase involved in cell wall biosynthesis